MQIAANIVLLPIALALGACGALPDLNTFRPPDSSTFFRPLSVTNVKDKTLPPVTAEDLVDANGRCAGAFAAVPAVSDDRSSGRSGASLPEAGEPAIAGPIALEMTECDVVKRAGLADKVEIGGSERNERTVALSYIQGPRPGLYHFAEGRLKSMERAPEPPAPQKPAKRTPKPKQAANR